MEVVEFFLYSVKCVIDLAGTSSWECERNVGRCGVFFFSFLFASQRTKEISLVGWNFLIWKQIFEVLKPMLVIFVKKNLKKKTFLIHFAALQQKFKVKPILLSNHYFLIYKELIS